MPVLNFKAQFVEPIRAGTKHHTIRADRKVPIKPGDKLYLYCGLRHKGAFRILPGAVACTRVISIRIHIVRVRDWVEEQAVWIEGQKLANDEAQALAVADGFPDWPAMRRFWLDTHGKSKKEPTRGNQKSAVRRVSFTGQIIHWR